VRKHLLIGLLATVALIQSQGANADEPPAANVRVQVVLRDTSDKLRVFCQSKGSLTGGLLIPFFNIGNAVRTDQRGDKLTEAVGGYARGPVLAASFEKIFPSKYKMFEVKAVEEGTVHASDADLIKRAHDGGFPYLILVDEDFTGLSSGTFVAQDDSVMVVDNAKIELFDTSSGDRILKTRGIASSLARQPLATALSSGDFFRTNFPAVADSIASFVVGQLLRTDNLHKMADTIGQGDQVPALAGVLKRYAGAVRISAQPPSGWHVVDIGTPYGKVLEPKSALKMKLGIRLEADLLLSEFGQDVTTLDDYLAAVSERYGDAGFDTATLLPYSGDGLAQLPGYTAYSMRRKGGTGGQIMFFKMLDKPYLAMKIVVATEDMDGLVAANRAAIEEALNDSEVTITSSN